MRRAVVTILVAAGIATLALARPALAQSEYRAVEAQRVGQYKAAVVAFDKAMALMDKKDLDGALDSLEVCFSQMPEFPDGHYLKAKILYTEKEYTRALPEIVLAREGHEKTADLRETMQKDRRTALQDRIKKKDDAIFDQQTLLATLPPEQRRRVEDKIGQLENEKATLLREVQEWSKGPVPVPARYCTLHGNILLRLQRYPEAVPQYEEALKIDPAYGEAANNLASIYHTTGQNAKALEVVTEAKKRGAKLHPGLQKAIEDALAIPR